MRSQRRAERDDAACLLPILVLQDYLDGVVIHQFCAYAHGVEQAAATEEPIALAAPCVAS